MVSSGSAVPTSAIGISQVQKPVIGLNFTLSNAPNEEPINTDTVLIQFTTLELTPNYLDDSKEMDIIVGVNVDSGKETSKKAEAVSFNNGNKLTQTLIENRSGIDISNLSVDTTGLTGDIISGEVFIRVNHPTISERSYREFFSISEGSIVDDFEDGTVGANWNPYQLQSGPTESDSRMRFDLATDKRTRIYYDRTDYRERKVRAEAEIKHENLNTNEGRPQIAFGFVNNNTDWYGLKATHDLDRLTVTYSSRSGSENNNVLTTNWTYSPFWVRAEWYPDSDEIRFYTALNDPSENGTWTHQYTDSNPPIKPKYPSYWGDDGSASTDRFRLQPL